ncbi:MAG: hypothetical protein ACK41T_00060 [Pseudobdellovibrio sp.]
MSKIYNHFHIFIIISIFFFTQFSNAQRIGDSRSPWQTTKTAHFEIFHSAEQQDLGLYYAKIAERAYADVTSIFTIAPKEKIIVIINDSTDLSNGFATLIPYPYIMIYPVQVGKDETLSEAGEWAHELFTHELTHIFQLYPAEGVYQYIKPIFGTVVAPNLFMPLWWKEGMAVEMETRLSHNGRTRSAFQDASIRALVAEDQLFKYTISEANESLPTWPYGSRPYLFGSLLMSQITYKGGTNALKELTNHQAHRAPYWIEWPHEKLFGYPYQTQYLEALHRYQDNATSQIKQISTQPITQVNTPIDRNLISARYPRYNKQTKILALIGMDKKNKKILFYTKNSDSSWSRLKLNKNPTDEVSSFEFHPHENKIIYAKADAFNSKKFLSDLYIYDISLDKSTRITRGERARNPLWTSDGNYIYYVSTFSGKTQLKRWNVKNETSEFFYETPFNNRIHDISLIDDQNILVSIKDERGQIANSTYSISNRTLSQSPLSEKNQEQHIKIRNNIFYYTSLKNGVSNIYKKEPSSTPTPITNFITGALEFDVNSDDSTLITSVFTKDGSQVYEVTPRKFENLPKVTNKINSQYTEYTPNKSSDDSFTTEESQSLKYLYPHYWIPFISTSTGQQGILLQAMTSGQDPLLIHRYNATLGYDTYLKKLDYSFDYTNSYFPWPVTLASYKSSQPVGGDLYTVDRQLNLIGISPDVFPISSKMNLMFGLQSSQVESLNLDTQHEGFFLSASYQNLKQTIFNIYPYSGIAASLRAETNKTKNQDLPARYGNYEQVIGSISLYASDWLPDNHSIMLKANFLHTFQNVSTRFGSSSSPFPTFSDNVLPEFVLRGYSLGQFYGSRISTLNTEYRFPVTTLNKGSGTDPYFFKRINGAIIADGLVVKGGAFDKNNNLHAESMQNSFWSVGAEGRLETTLGYMLPVNFIIGYYMPLSPQYAESSQLALSLQIGGFNR